MLAWFKRLLDKLTQPKSVLITPPVSEKPQLTRNERVLMMAMGEIGQKEIPGKGENQRIREYHAFASQDNRAEMSEDIAWCASFVCWVLEMLGMGSTNSRAARSFLKWGLSSKSDPLPGDVVVFWRVSKTSWQGHVGFYLGETKTHIICLGGNQSNAVNVAQYSKNQLLDIRRSSKHEPITDRLRASLWSKAEDIRAGRKIDASGNML